MERNSQDKNFFKNVKNEKKKVGAAIILSSGENPYLVHQSINAFLRAEQDGATSFRQRAILYTCTFVN
jgi:hypothetical protein